MMEEIISYHHAAITIRHKGAIRCWYDEETCRYHLILGGDEMTYKTFAIAYDRGDKLDTMRLLHGEATTVHAWIESIEATSDWFENEHYGVAEFHEGAGCDIIERVMQDHPLFGEELAMFLDDIE